MSCSPRRIRPLADRSLIARALAIFCAILIANASDGATLRGKTAPPGGTLDLQFPIDNYFQQVAAQGGNPRPTNGRALMFFPKNFDAARLWPILIINSTADLDRTNTMDAPAYRDAATKEGWVVLGADPTIRPRVDSAAWRFAVLAAALQMIRQDWPQSVQWPVALAGFSGGAKAADSLAPMLAASGKVRVCGIFLGGINSDRLSAAYQEVHPSADFLNVPIWISGGADDKIAPPASEQLVYYSVKRAGFRQVRLEQFFGGHKLNTAEIQAALRWFRKLGKF